MFMLLFVWLPLGLYAFIGLCKFINAIFGGDWESDEDRQIDAMREEWNRKNL